MAVHQYDNDMRSDTEFINGNIDFLAEGNHCRLLDGRRTSGIIEKYFKDSAMFRWRITKYEDKGKYWDLPAENIKRFQFEKDSKRLSSKEILGIEKAIENYQKIITITVDEDERENILEEVKETMEETVGWLKENSLFIRNGEKLNFSSAEGPEDLAKDLKSYMKYIGLSKEEELTADTMVLNPNSGEWIKGMKIVLAEMGLASFKGKVPRTKDIFQGIGSKENRRKYIINRLAFIRAYFSMLGINEVILYRGMSNENLWQDISRTLLPCTFSLEVGQAFSDFNRESKYRSSYLVKMTVPVEKLFMTYLETEAMNRQYKEAEALILYDKPMKL